MKRFGKFLFSAILAGCLAFALTACQSAPATVAADKGLVPSPASTGNPPLIPHDIEDADNGEVCLGCHGAGEGGAPKVPGWHAGLVDCRGCHIHLDEKSQPFSPQY